MITQHKRAKAPRDHPYADKDGWVKEHRLNAEKAVGKFLDLKHPVHHHNNELVICEDVFYHRLLHTRTDALRVCGNAKWRKCHFCKQYDDPNNLSITALSGIYHKECNNDYYHKRKNERKCQ